MSIITLTKSTIFALAFLITAGYGVSKSMNGNADLNDLALSNGEALAQNENPPNVIPCYGTIRTYPNDSKFIRAWMDYNLL
jgi:hypothetical protein